MIKQYLRDENRNPIGLVVMDKFGNYGWSKCARGDKFDKDLAHLIAYNRYDYNVMNKPITNNIPIDVKKLITHVSKRVLK